ncbi:hypothetical protein JCM3774_006412 [Rhodotorula dairenensis]
MSYRASLYPGASLAPTSSTSAPHLLASAHDKQRECTAYESVRDQALDLAAFLNAYADNYTTLTGGSEAVGDVVEHWQNVFRITALTLGSLAQKRAELAQTAGSDADPLDVVLPPGTLPDKLVRIPVRPADDEQQQQQQQQQQHQYPGDQHFDTTTATAVSTEARGS